MPNTHPSMRSAAAADVESIAGVWHRGWREVHSGHVPEQVRRHRRLADLRRQVTERIGATTVATSGSVVVGFVMVCDDEVEHLYVEPSARGGNVADALLRHGEAVIARRHAFAWLAVVPSNARARRFYERNGWTDAGAYDHLPRDTGGVPSAAVPARRYEKAVHTAGTGSP